MQELPNLVNTKLSEGKENSFYLGCYSCRTETINLNNFLTVPTALVITFIIVAVKEKHTLYFD
jgi:hypothetical protein